MFNLEGKNALITGASGGIGGAIAKSLSKLGANVVISGTREGKLQALKSEISGKCEILTCNLSDFDQVESLFSKAEEFFGSIDILVCNAGITKDNLIMRVKNEDWDDVLNVNLKSTFILNKNAATKMIRRKFGRIINISSVVGVSGNPGQANYCASKAGMIGMGKSIAMDIAKRGVTVNAVAPGFIATEMTDTLNDKQKIAINDKIPAGKMGSVNDIASAVCFLSSNESGYITGQTLHVNGGMLMI
ncbi:MAG: 3-oxoacyl-[acyl-carrier protein] reductase [Rickettsiales bacterium]|jgi:3-oxoacyl-[acyl-carrier protein] reductase